MRKFKFILVIALLSSLFLQSCNSKVDNPSMYALVTVKENFMANTWFGLTDNGEKIYPGDVSRISGYKAEDGQRAMISFTPLDEKVQGYEYNAIIYDITNITTKSIVVLSDPSLDTLGTSKAGLGETWIAGGYLNSNVVVPGNYYTQHYINLVYNELDQDGDDSDYVNLELRVKIKGSSESELLGETARSICFKLEDFNPFLHGKKGIILKYRPIRESGQEFKTIKIEDKPVSEY